jgi:Domain of unknown function (DUF4326)
MPQRIQRKRTKGWRRPQDAIYVGRPSRWGNPYHVGVDGTAEACVRLFESHYAHDADYQAAVCAALAGKDLACWCPPGAWCHGDVLLRWANGA